MKTNTTDWAWLNHVNTPILKYDPYFEDDGTLWVLHYHLATNESLVTTWYWFFNIFGARSFSQDLFLIQLGKYVEGFMRRKFAPRTLERDFRCLVRTYSRHQEGKAKGASAYNESYDCPLTALRLLQQLPLYARLTLRCVDKSAFEGSQAERRQDILTYLAMIKLQGLKPPLFHALPINVQGDIKAIWRTYTAAQIEGNRFLFSIGSPEVLREAVITRSGKGLTVTPPRSEPGWHGITS